MKFYPLTDSALDVNELQNEYQSGREIGVIRLAETVLFFRARMKTYFIPYSEITRAFRRVMLVPARMCCGRGNLSIENLVICGAAKNDAQATDSAAQTESGASEVELAQIQLPGEKAAKLLMEELKVRIPHAEFTKPAAPETDPS